MIRLKLKPMRWLLIFYAGNNRRVSKVLRLTNTSVVGKHRVHHRLEQWKLAGFRLVAMLSRKYLVKPDAVRVLMAQLADSSKVSSALILVAYVCTLIAKPPN